MLENEIQILLVDTSSFGKLNVTLYFEESSNIFDQINRELIEIFKPNDIQCSLFDLDTEEVTFVTSIKYPTQKNAIAKVLYINNKEQLHLEYFENQFIIEHLFYSDDIQALTGHLAIEKCCKREGKSVLTIGYELSIHINSYELSLQENLSDASLHPIFLIRMSGDDNFSMKRYGYHTSNIDKQKIQVMTEYLRLINQKWVYE